MGKQAETPKETEDKIIFDLKLITKRVQQITTVAVFLSMCVAAFSMVYGLFFTPPIRALQEYNKIQDKRMSTQDKRMDSISDKQARQEEIYHDIRKDQAVMNEKVSRVLSEVLSMREDMKARR